MQLFLYEFISAGGLGATTPPALRAEGWAMLASLADDFAQVKDVKTLTLLDDTCPRPLGHFCRRVHSEDEAASFQEMVARADMALVIAPEFDNFLTDRSRLVLDAGKVLLGSIPRAIELTGDKLALYRHFLIQGVPTPLTIPLYHDNSTIASNIAFPAVCKPRHGAGSRATFLIRKPEELSRMLQEARAEMPRNDFLMQPFASGQPASITFLIGSKQRIALLPATQEISADGRFHYLGGKLPLPEPLAMRTRVLADKALGTVDGLSGLVGVDLILGEAADGSQDRVIEINPRPTTSYIGLRQLARDNLAAAVLRISRGEEIAPLRWRDGIVQFSVTGITP
jgi:tyramine---L-glutamate ligase